MKAKSPKKKARKGRKGEQFKAINIEKQERTTWPLGYITVAVIIVLGSSYLIGVHRQNSSTEVTDNETCGTGDGGTCVSTDECGIWIAPSTIQNGGLGMFAGRAFQASDILGIDHVIPVFDLGQHQGSGWPFLWNAYFWNSDGEVSGEAEEVDLAVIGFGSTANAHMDLNNVVMNPTTRDKGFYYQRGFASASSSPYYQTMTAKEDIQQGQEFFMNYGNSWFVRRTWFMGHIPLQGDVYRANSLLQTWHNIEKTHAFSTKLSRAYWDRLVWNNPYNKNTSRILNALPKVWTNLEDAMHSDLKTQLQKESTRSLEWLEQNGVCADNMKAGPSTISGRGAFATRFLEKDSIVATLPLIHVPYRWRLEMHFQEHKHEQVMLNYCYGHRNSTILLCPYSPVTSFVNHDGREPNVKLAWGSSKSSSHHPDWLHLTVDELHRQKQYSGLAFELLALRDINKGEEIVMDSGAEWEAAWKRHIQTYSPRHDADDSTVEPYTSELHAPNGFRHDIRIPDDMFPEAWKNGP